MAKQIVILGAGFAGIPLAHKLLKHTLPKSKDTKVVLVSVSTHLYWNLAAVRAVIPGEVPDDKLFTPIKDGFSKYKSSEFELIIGKATGVDLEQNTVTVESNESGAAQSVSYDQLILATGSHVTSGLPFKHIGTSEETIEALHGLQSKIKAAKSIVVAGSGPTGVETIGELAHAYAGKKDLTFIIAGPRALEGLLPSVGKFAEKELAKSKVKLLYNTTVTSSAQDEGSGQTTLTLSDGKTLSTDVYIPLIGLTPNTSFLPPTLLDERGNVKLDLNLRVIGTKNVWAVGDVGNLETKQAMKAEGQVILLAKNLDAVLTGNAGAVANLKLSDKPAIFITVGKGKGTGQVAGFKVFSFLVAYVKGRTLFVEKAPPVVDGKVVLNSSI